MSPLPNGLLALGAGLLVAVVTTPVGVSGAVFLLPIQLDVLRVPSPAVTPTNLLFNVIATPGALLRYHRTGRLGGPLVPRLLAGTVPGVIAGSILRVYVAPGEGVFRVLAACLLGPLGLWLVLRRQPRSPETVTGPGPVTITTLGVAVGIIGGIYGIGGGSLLGPLLVGLGMPIAAVAPAALASTFVTSVAGVVTYGVLALVAPGPVGPDWSTGILCGIGGLLGGYLGARLAPWVPDAALRILLGLLAVGLATAYLVQVLT
ncbi:MAG: sulfite exporter TauE/SafE family protein [Pseudonocardia sp.]|nr:sulfite exporter TauE/SafE family protein [Pseudonocardia sp.]